MDPDDQSHVATFPPTPKASPSSSHAASLITLPKDDETGEGQTLSRSLTSRSSISSLSLAAKIPTISTLHTTLNPQRDTFKDFESTPTRSCLRMSTENVRVLAPIYRAGLQISGYLASTPAVLCVMFPSSQILELLSRINFPIVQAIASLYVISRLDGRPIGVKEIALYSCLPFMLVCDGVQRCMNGHYVNATGFFLFALYYVGLFKIIRRLRKRLNALAQVKIQEYLQGFVFRSFSSLVPILYLSTESVGCLAANYKGSISYTRMEKNSLFRTCGGERVLQHSAAISNTYSDF